MPPPSTAAAGDVSTMVYMLDECGVALDHTQQVRARHSAAAGGHVAVLQELRDRYGAPPYCAVLEVAADAGHLAVLTWALESAPPPPPEQLARPRQEFDFACAAYSGRVEVMEWLRGPWLRSAW